MTHDHAEVRASPMLPVADLDRALEHYAALGFLVSRWDDGYGFAAWHGLELHLVLQPGHDPASVFLHVPDADVVFERWAGAGVGRTTAPEPRPWNVREGEHVDEDGNRLRFGSPLPSGG
jgi:catechol 2,3-dioxygenase-like lactoylglutathione lyase family enzyme